MINQRHSSAVRKGKKESKKKKMTPKGYGKKRRIRKMLQIKNSIEMETEFGSKSCEFGNGIEIGGNGEMGI